MGDGSVVEVPAEENVVPSNSEQVEMDISHILEKINNFTQMVNTTPYLKKGEICDFQTPYLNTFFAYDASFLDQFVRICATYYHHLKVSELLESGKSMLKELSDEFEERMIL